MTRIGSILQSVFVTSLPLPPAPPPPAPRLFFIACHSFPYSACQSYQPISPPPTPFHCLLASPAQCPADCLTHYTPPPPSPLKWTQSARHEVICCVCKPAVRQMLDEVTGLRYLMTLWRLWRDVRSHMLVSYRACFVSILKVSHPQCCPHLNPIETHKIHVCEPLLLVSDDTTKWVESHG